MIPQPTMYLRFIERRMIVERHADHTVTRPVNVLQQFWAHPDGPDIAGDEFRPQRGYWRDVPLEVPR